MSRRILQETITSSFADDDYLYMDGATNGARIITPNNLVSRTTAVTTLTNGLATANNAIDNLESEVDGLAGVSGGVASVNLIQYPFANTSKTENGITWTVNDDGTITANGEATGDTSFYLTATLENTAMKTYGGTYTISIGVDGSSNTTFFLNGLFSSPDKSTYTYFHSATNIYQSEYTVDCSSQGYGYFGGVYLKIKSGYTANNLTFMPMIRYSIIENNTFVKYGDESVIPYLARAIASLS